MYFYKIEGGTELADSEPAVPQQLREGVALNSPVESSLEKLGWFRWERGKGWTVRKGLEKVTQAQVGNGRRGWTLGDGTMEVKEGREREEEDGRWHGKS